MRASHVVLAVVAAVRIAAAQSMPGSSPELDALDATYIKQMTSGDSAGMLATAKKALEAQRKLTGDDPVYTWRREQTLMSTLQQVGANADALALQKTMLAQAEKAHGKDSSEVRDVLGYMTGTLEMTHALDELESTFVRLLELTKKLHGEKSSLYAQDLLRYASTLGTRGEYVAEARIQEQALAILVAQNVDVTAAYVQLAITYMQFDHAKAKATFDRYIAAMKKIAPQQHAGTLLWVATVYRVANRADLAEPLEKEAIAMRRAEIAAIEKAKGADSPELANQLFDLGWQLQQIGDLAGADALLARGVDIAEKKKLPFVPYAQLATVRRKEGKPKEALELFKKAQAMMPGGTGLYTMMGDIERELGNTKEAERLYLAFQRDQEKFFGKHAILVGRPNLGLFAVYLSAKQVDKAERLLAEELELAERDLAFVLAQGTEKDHLAHFVRTANLLDTAITFHAKFAPKRASAAKLAMTTLLRRKGRILDAAAASLGALRQRLSADDKKLLAELDDARAQLAKIAVQGGQANPNFDKQVAALSDHVQKLEVELAKRNAELKLAIEPVKLAAVQAKIGKDARLVELVNYQPADIIGPYTGTPKLAPRRYAAYVLASKGDPQLVDLGDAQAIDDVVAKLRTALSNPDNDAVTTSAKAAYDLTIGKLATALGPAKQILIAPDGALNVVPFAALYDGKHYLVERYTFTYLTSGRDLLRFGARAAAAKAASPVIFADPDFDVTPGAKQQSAAPVSRGRRSRAMQGLHWPRLPGTAQEADALTKTIPGVTVYREKQATESMLKGLHAPRILHLATHGFFLTDEDASVENPLLRAGLAFAGANGSGSGADDGIVTALEAAGLDLRGTRLVALSACETGVGKITNGDGVYGLRRAFVIAGAESLVMSMWEVDDAATRDLMAGYYTKLENGMGRSAALQAIQREMLANKKYAHPYYWASFIAAGDDSPITK